MSSTYSNGEEMPVSDNRHGRRSPSSRPAATRRNLTFKTGCSTLDGTHADYAHAGEVDRCLCGHKERLCEGDCGLIDVSWLTHKGDAAAA